MKLPMWLVFVAALSIRPAASELAAARSHILAGDPAAAAAEFRRLAEQGDAEAQASLAEMMFTGRGIDRDQEVAIASFRRAANQGYVGAQIRLGSIYAAGSVVPKDPVRAYMWFHRSSMMGTEQAGEILTGLAAEMTEQRIADAWRPGAQ